MAKKLFSKKGFISKQKTFQPTIKNESIIDDHQIESHREITSNLKDAASIDARIAKFSLVSEHSVLRESGIQKGVSILQESGITSESMWDGFDSLTGSSSGSNNDLDQQLRSAVDEARAMARNEGCALTGFAVSLTGYLGSAGVAGPSAGYAAGRVCQWLDAWVDETMDESHRESTGSATAAQNEVYWENRKKRADAKENENTNAEDSKETKDATSAGQTDSTEPMSVPTDEGCTNPEVDNEIGGIADPQAVQRMNEEIKNFIDPSSTPGPDGDYVTQYPDILTSPDPSILRDQYINWGDENTGWGNFPAPDFNPDNIVDPSVNWGEYYTDMGPVLNVGTPFESKSGCSFDEINKDSVLELVPVVDNI
jgi:hypothetical protein